jgi:hypothetical protein
MSINDILLRIEEYAPLLTKGSDLTPAEADVNFREIYKALVNTQEVIYLPQAITSNKIEVELAGNPRFFIIPVSTGDLSLLDIDCGATTGVGMCLISNMRATGDITITADSEIWLGGEATITLTSKNSAWFYIKDNQKYLINIGGETSKWEYLLYNDWYLPAYSQIAKIITEIHDEGLGSFSGQLMSSTTNYETIIEETFWYYDFGTESWNNGGDKSTNYKVRPVRDFESTEVYALRDVVGGGWIYDIEDLGGGNFKYYVVPDIDLETETTFGTAGVDTLVVDADDGKKNTIDILAIDPTAPACLYCTSILNNLIIPKEVDGVRPQVPIDYINPTKAIDTLTDASIFAFFKNGFWKNITWDGIKSALGLSITASKTLTVTEDTTLSGGTHSGTNTGDQDLSGLKLKPNQVSITSSATPTPTGNYQENELYITALAEASELQAPAGTPVNGNKILARIDAAAEQNLTYNAIYSGNMPKVVEAGIPLYMEFIYNSTSSKFEYIESGGGGHEIYSQEEITPVEQRKSLRFKGFLQAIDNPATEETEVEIDDALTSTFGDVVEVIVKVEDDDSLGRNLVDDEWTNLIFDRDGEEGQRGYYGDWYYECIQPNQWVRYPANKDIKQLFHTDVDVIASLEDESNWTSDNEYDPDDLPENLDDAVLYVNKNFYVSTLYVIINAGSGDVARIRTYTSSINRLSQIDIEEHGILVLEDINGVSHNGCPSVYAIDSIIIKETEDVEAGDISIGTTTGGNDVVDGVTLGALSEVFAPIGSQFFSTTVNQNLYISSTIGAVIEFSINTGGTDYQVDDELTIVGGNNDFTIKVLTVGGSGEVLTAEIITAGTGYSIANDYAVTGGSGNDDCTIDISNLGFGGAKITLKINIKKVW